MSVLSTVWAEMLPEARAFTAAWCGTAHPEVTPATRADMASHHAALHVCDAALASSAPDTTIYAVLPNGGAHGIGSISLPGLVRPTAHALRRAAIGLLSGSTGAACLGGNFYSWPGELAGVACVAARLAREEETDAEAAMHSVVEWTAAVVSERWDSVKLIAPLLQRGPSEGCSTVSAVLWGIRGAISMDRLPERTEVSEQLAKDLGGLCEGVMALTSKLREFEQ